jgi:hypothetical protein
MLQNLQNLRLPSPALDPEAPSDRGTINVPRLAVFFSCCVVLWFYILGSVGPAISSRGGGLGLFLSDALLTFPLAFVAAKAWLWSTRERATAHQSVIVLLARAALIASIFAVFVASASCLHQLLDRAFGGAPTHVFHGRPRGPETGWLGEIIYTGLLDGLLAYFVAGPLAFLGLARPHRRARSLVPAAVAVALVAASVAASAFTLGNRLHPVLHAAGEHAQMVTRVPMEVGFEVNDLRVTVKAAQWVRQPRSTTIVGLVPAKIASNSDLVYLDITFENTGALLRSVGRREFSIRASNGATWAPLADDFPDILLSPAETLTTRLIFEIPPQAGQLVLVSRAGAAETRVPIGDDFVGGIFGALCRALSKPWGS